jgi:crotonobetainyl-CoA:carnitine CoA-transferase CaiB-like acyl-CoA transferase
MPLQGLRVIVCGPLDAGSSVGTVFADFGADVIRVEPPGGDPARENPEGETSWAAAARSSRSLTLLLSDPRGADLLLKLAEEADVLAEAFGPEEMESWGLGPDVLREVNPGLVIVRGAEPRGAGAWGAAAALTCLWWRRHGGSGQGQVVDLRADGSGAAAVLPLLAATPGRVRWPGPALGRHTEEIVAELGMTRGELEDLRADGVA